MLAASLLMTTHTFVPANSAGRTNKSVANTVLSGKGIPTTKIGINGDFYIDLNTFNIFGPKANNRWPTPVSLRGPAGADGKQGERGSSGSSSSGNKGEQGDKGEKGEKGEKGDKGDKGEKGDTGATGLKGDKGDNGLVGATGVQGLKGDKGDKGDTGATGLIGLTGPTGLQGATGLTGAAGAKGDTGAKGDKGDTGLQGLQGLKGDTGTTGTAGAKGDKGDKGDTGAAGPVNVQYGTISFATTLAGNSGNAIDSRDFGNLESGKKYVFDVLIWGKSTFSTTSLSLSAKASVGAPTITPFFVSTYTDISRDASSQREYSVIAKIIVDGTGTTQAYKLAVSISVRSNIPADESITLSGGFTGYLAESLTTP